MHANFSNGAMRDEGGEELFKKICEEFGKNIDRHISVYGADNNQRLTGLHETQSIDKFSYGVSDRGASIRIPVGTIQDGWKGRLEDRRPASNGDPYKIAAAIIKPQKKLLLNFIGFRGIYKGDGGIHRLFLFSLTHDDYKFIPIFFKKAKNSIMMTGLFIELSFSFSSSIHEASII